MANDVTSLTAIVQSDLTGLGGASAITSAMILTEIQSAIKDYERSRFYFNERSLAITISQTSTYALSLFAAAGSGVSDIVEIDYLDATVNGNTEELDEITYDEYRKLNSNATLSGYPTRYAVFQQSVFLYPKPNNTYTATMAAHVRFTEVSGGSDTNAWLTDGRELIRRAVLKKIYGTLIKDFEQAQAQGLAEQQALQGLQRGTDALSGHRVTGYL